jgi:hypothetical protein
MMGYNYKEDYNDEGDYDVYLTKITTHYKKLFSAPIINI